MILKVLATLCALFHFYAFALESILWGRPKTNKVFATNPQDAETQRLLAFNQGFYNLFLALGIVLGLILQAQGNEIRGTTLIDYAMASAFGAGAVLYVSERKLLRAALGQALPSVLYFAFRFMPV